MLLASLVLVAIVPTQGSASKPATTADAYAMAKPWIADGLQIADAEKRKAAIETIRAALAGNDATAKHAALIAFNALNEVRFDKRPFRAAILPMLESESGAARCSALYALNIAGAEPSDLNLVLARADDPSPEVQNALIHLLAVFNKGELTGKAGEVALRMIATDDYRTLHQRMNGLWGARVSPEIERRLLELAASKNPEIRHEAIYFGLSTIREKSGPVVDALLEAVVDPDPNNSQRALWGLGHDVSANQQAKVAEAMVRLFESRSSAMSQTECVRVVGLYGDTKQIPWLESVAKNPQAARPLVERAEQSLREIRSRAR